MCWEGHISVPDQLDVEVVEPIGKNQREHDGQTADAGGKHGECLQFVPGGDLFCGVSIQCEFKEKLQQDEASAIDGQVNQRLARKKLESYFSTIIIQTKR